jgi:hypothetical protein
LENFNQPPPLNAHARQADEVRATEPIKVNVLDVFIDQGDFMVVRNQGGEQSKAGDGQVGSLAE